MADALAVTRTPERGRLLRWLPIVVVLLLLATLAIARSVGNDPSKTLVADGDYNEIAFFASESMRIGVQSTDDVFAAGGEIAVRDARADNLVVAGGELSFETVEVEDAIIAGADIAFTSGRVSDDLIAAGAEVTLAPGFEVGGAAMLAGADVSLKAPIGSYLRITGETVVLDSEVVGDAEIFANTLTIGPNARLGGDLRYRADDLTVDPAAEIAGTREVIPESEAESRAYREFGNAAVAAAAMTAIFFILGAFVLVGVITIALPRLLDGAEREMQVSPLRTLGIGALIAVAGPFLLLFLFWSGFGVMLALFIATVYLVATPLAVAAVCYYLGLTARSLTGRGDDAPGWIGRVGWSFAGLAGLLLLGLIPFIGVFVWLIAIAFGFGAVMMVFAHALSFGAGEWIAPLPTAPAVTA